MYAACRDQGVNFFDCANVYSGGRAEEFLGRLIGGHRDEVVITSKCAMPTDGDINARGANRRYITGAVEQSLQRLDTDRLDVFFMHRWDPLTPLEETLRGLEDVVRDGKVLYLGASNYAAWQIATGLGISARCGWSRFEVLQPMYNLVKRQVEVEILPLAAAEEIGVITYGPVGGGLLSGKYGSGKRPSSGRILDNREYKSRYGEDWVFDVAGAFTRLAGEQGVHPVSLAVAWVAAHPAVTCPIIGARSLEQLRPSLQAPAIDMTPTLREAISELSPTPPPATDRLEEQAG
jgi:aryl-alcohol dehydrogenase-like predicted oxidoreductase